MNWRSVKIHDQDVIRIQAEDAVIDDTEEVLIRHAGADRLFTIEEGPDLIIAEVGGREHQSAGVNVIHEHHFLFLRNRVEIRILTRELHGHIAGRAVTDLNRLHFRMVFVACNQNIIACESMFLYNFMNFRYKGTSCIDAGIAGSGNGIFQYSQLRI